MLSYDLEARGAVARYDYLYRCIKGDIRSGQLKGGERLPSKRQLASHLQVAVVTVENAYAQLVAEGYLIPEEKRGYFVSTLEFGQGAQPPYPQADIPSPPQADWLLDLKSEGSATQGFPFSVWARLMRKTLSEQGEALLGATPNRGVYELRQALSRHLYHSRGISAPPERIVVGAGAEYLYNLIVQLLGREAVYGVEDPGYSKAARVYALGGARSVPLAVDGQGVSPMCAQNSGAHILHLSPNHQFPTGALTPIGRRQSLLRWAQEQSGRYIIEDDYDSEFRFTGRPIPTLQSIDTAGQVIYMNTFSRTLAPSLRVGYMVLPQSLLEQYRQRLGFYSSTVPAMEQYTLASFLEGGHFDSHISRMRVFYRARRDQVLAAIENSTLFGRCRWLEVDAGLHFLLELDTSKSDAQLAQQAKEQGIRLSFLSDYQQRDSIPRSHTLVVNYPGVALENLAQALTRLGELL